MVVFVFSQSCSCVRVSARLLQPERFREAVRATGCPAFDLAFLLWPVARDEDGTRTLKPTMQMQNLSTFRTYMQVPFESLVYNPSLLYTVVLPWLQAAAAPRVVLHITALGSISTTLTTHAPSSRMMQAAMYSLVRVISMDMPKAIVIGAHVGLWLPGLRGSDKLASGITALEALRRLWSIVTQVQAKHSGFVIDHTLKIVPP